MKLLGFLLFILLSNSVFGGPLQLDASDCSLCELIVEIFNDYVEDNALVDDCAVKLIEFICTTFKIDGADSFVCQAMIPQFKDEVIYIVHTVLKEPKNLCGLIFSSCNYKWDPQSIRWPLPLPGIKPEHKDVPLPPQNSPTIKVLHLSDLHMDTQYLIGSEALCDAPLCCRAANNTNEFFEETAPKLPAAKWGMVGPNCDLPYWTFENMLQHINATHNDIDYIVVSGDLESHADWEYSTPSHANMIANVSNLLRKYFPTINSYFAIGNHEGVPIDSIAPHYVPENLQYKLYPYMAEAWKGWVPADQQDVLLYRGSYMVKIFPGLRLISLNTQYGDPNNFFLYINQTDPDGTMSWFIEQLAIAEYAGDKVQIVAHIPSGSSEAYEGWAENYYSVVNRFEDTIVGQFFGHEHSEQYAMTYIDPDDPTSRPTSIIFSAPSATTYSDYNPAYRIYTIDGNYSGSTFQILDFEEWYLNLTLYGNANETTWEQLYNSSKEVYGMKNMTPYEWNNLAERMRTNDTLFQIYLKNYYRRTDSQRNDLTCDAKCKAGYLCDIRQAHHSDKLCADLGLQQRAKKPPKYRKVDKKNFKPKISSHEEVIELIRNFQNVQNSEGKTNNTCPF